ncbi:MAG TPA: ankyrin repeat domain-containing protein, partial [Gemmatimonadaceae bacterium]|nr:ankyrin repeat domain-containing protein [Gemmatimonadaceae bacterium]
GLAGWMALTAAVEALRASRDQGARDRALQTLLGAAASGDTQLAAAVLDAHAGLVSERGVLPGHTGLRSALHFAVGGNHEEMVKLLLARGADPNVRDEGDDAVPLHFAAEKGHAGIIHLLVAHGSDTIGAGDMHGRGIVGWATCFGTGQPEIVEYLLAHGAKHTIFSAVAVGALDEIRSLAAADPACLNAVMDRANRRRVPLHLAVVKKQAAALAVLLELGAGISARDAAGLTPLDQAALDGEAAMAELLIEHGALLDLPAAVALDRSDDIARLLRAEPDVLAPGHRLGTLIVRAAERAPGHVIEALIRGGASVNVEDDELTAVDGTLGYTPLHAAAFHGNLDATRVLLAHGAGVTTRESKYSATPIGWANYAHHGDVVETLIHGPVDVFDAIEHDRLDRIRDLAAADPEIVDREFGTYLRAEPREDFWWKPWWTPLSFAIRTGKTEAARLLRELGAAVPAPDQRA